jgi:serine/threonine-protein kinase
VHIVDLDMYHQGPFTNEMGRMFGSKRFMAPEELELGAQIDERTTLFTMGRTAAVFLSDNSLEREPFRGSDALYEVYSAPVAKTATSATLQCMHFTPRGRRREIIDDF